jgi:dienelactone hydrolase
MMALAQHIVGRGAAAAAGALACALLAQPAMAQRHVQEKLSVSRIDGSPMEIEIVRPQTGGRVPLVVVVEGACAPGEAGAGAKALDPRANPGRPFARLTVNAANCTADVAGQLVLDHLRALEYVRRRVSWWNAELLVWGSSDGAAIAAQLAAFTPETARVVLGGADAKVSNILKDAAFSTLVFHGADDQTRPVVDVKAAAASAKAAEAAMEFWEIPGMEHDLVSAGGNANALRAGLIAWLFDDKPASVAAARKLAKAE